VRAGAFLAVSAIDKVRTDWATVDDCIKDAILDQKGSKDAGELVRLHILVSVLPSFAKGGKEPNPEVQKSLNKSKEWIRKTLDDFPFRLEHLPALLDGINFPAQWNLGFTEPFSRLAFTVQKLVREARDPRVAVVVFHNLGNGVGPTSLYWPALQQQWTQILTKVPLDWLMAGKKQRMETGKAMLAGLKRPEWKLKPPQQDFLESFDQKTFAWAIGAKLVDFS
jgi:hypothetical protein